MARRYIRKSEDFWRSVDVRGPEACWEWTGPRTPQGYGYVTVGKKQIGAHRWSFAEKVGILPPRWCACHRCDNPPCVNPAHLFAGTRTDNMTDKQRKGRTYRAIADETGRMVLARRAEGRSFREIMREFRIGLGSVERIVYGQLRWVQDHVATGE